jgi:hypothetical protein
VPRGAGGVQHRGDGGGGQPAAARRGCREDVLEHPVAAAVDQQRVGERAALLERREGPRGRGREHAAVGLVGVADLVLALGPRLGADPLVAQAAHMAVGDLLGERHGRGRLPRAVAAEQQHRLLAPAARLQRRHERLVGGQHAPERHRGQQLVRERLGLVGSRGPVQHHPVQVRHVRQRGGADQGRAIAPHDLVGRALEQREVERAGALGEPGPVSPRRRPRPRDGSRSGPPRS